MNKTMNMRGRRGRIIAVLLAAVLGHDSCRLGLRTLEPAQQRQRKWARRQPWRADHLRRDARLAGRSRCRGRL